MADDADLTYFLLTGHESAVIADTDDDGINPDKYEVWVPVTITARPEVVYLTSTTPPKMKRIRPVNARIETGVLKLVGGPEDDGVRLPANTAVLELDGLLLYDVAYGKSTINGVEVDFKDQNFTFAAPTSDTTVDLTTVTRVAGPAAGQGSTPITVNPASMDDIVDASAVGKAVARAASAAIARAAIGVGEVYTPGGTDVPIIDGGTGASTAAGARTNLSVMSAAEVATAITNAVNALLDGAPGALDTLNELAAAVNDDASFAATVTSALTGKQASSAKLTALAAQTWAADTISYQTSTSAVSTTALTAAGRALVDDADAAAQRVTLGLKGAATRVVTPEDFGAVGDGVTNDSAAMVAMFDTYATANGGACILIPYGKVYLSDRFDLQSNTYVFGDGTIKCRSDNGGDGSGAFATHREGAHNITWIGPTLDINHKINVNGFDIGNSDEDAESPYVENLYIAAHVKGARISTALEATNETIFAGGGKGMALGFRVRNCYINLRMYDCDIGATIESAFTVNRPVENVVCDLQAYDCHRTAFFASGVLDDVWSSLDSGGYSHSQYPGVKVRLSIQGGQDATVTHPITDDVMENYEAVGAVTLCYATGLDLEIKAAVEERCTLIRGTAAHSTIRVTNAIMEDLQDVWDTRDVETQTSGYGFIVDNVLQANVHTATHHGVLVRTHRVSSNRSVARSLFDVNVWAQGGAGLPVQSDGTTDEFGVSVAYRFCDLRADPAVEVVGTSDFQDVPTWSTGRHMAGLFLSGPLHAQGSLGTSEVYASFVGSDAENRFAIDTNGTMLWGSGSVAPDVTLYRDGANILGTDDRIRIKGNMLEVTPSSGTADAFATYVGADAEYRHEVDADGQHSWGDGTNPPDTNLYRFSANTLQTDDRLRVGTRLDILPSSGTAEALNTFASADAENRMTINASGKHSWGSGAVAQDTTLERVAAGLLKANGNIIRAGGNVVAVDTTLTADDYLNVLTGTVARAFTLPVVSGNTGVELVFKNRSTQTLTVQRAGSDQLYDTAAVSSITVAAGASARVINDGTYWLVVT